MVDARKLNLSVGWGPKNIDIHHTFVLPTTTKQPGRLERDFILGIMKPQIDSSTAQGSPVHLHGSLLFGLRKLLPVAVGKPSSMAGRFLTLFGAVPSPRAKPTIVWHAILLCTRNDPLLGSRATTFLVHNRRQKHGSLSVATISTFLECSSKIRTTGDT